MFEKFVTCSVFTLLIGAPCLADDASMTRDTVMTVLRGVGALDVDAILAGYADDAIVVTPDGTYRGTDDLRSYYEAFVAEFSQPDISQNTETLIFEDGAALVIWNGYSPERTYEFAADSYFVVDGKIVAATFAEATTEK